MIIDSEWVINCINQTGNTVIIPKEATIIKNGAFDTCTLQYYCTNYSEEQNLNISFESGCRLDSIETTAFSAGGNASITINLPQDVTRIERLAFIGDCKVQLPENFKIEMCEDDSVFSHYKNINIPQNLKFLYLDNSCESSVTIVIPDNAQLQAIQTYDEIDTVVLPNGQKLSSTEDKPIKGIRLCNNTIMILYKNDYEIRNKDDLEILYNRKYLCIRG